MNVTTEQQSRFFRLAISAEAEALWFSLFAIKPLLWKLHITLEPSTPSTSTLNSTPTILRKTPWLILHLIIPKPALQIIFSAKYYL